MLEYLKQHNIPIILTTSKTRAEVIIWQQRLGIVEPFISENGAAIFFPKEYKSFCLDSYPSLDGYKIATLGKEYKFITTYLDTVKKKYSIRGFFNMSVEEVMQETTLDKASATLAKKRDFSEPFLIEDESLIPLLEKEASLYGLKITKGGRFYHCIGVGQDKGKALQVAQAIYKRSGYDTQSIALGDGQNDESMLRVADVKVLIPSKSLTYEKMNIDNLIKAEFAGPQGWSESLAQILKI